ncbi:hypothetical protein [Weissella cibaria]|uniref:hypothetical protein n=1 Tax=Weissella cibaria TaxID=137591 RepID=UPI0002191FFA|nr:hypothetical protein [Weissella cibaria]APS27838.1 hypothetical protein AUC63_01840 [Weissella cibaria]APU63237.1 hypothetical protein AUC65_01447 [Weissella cibaria]APU65387.1 hypothetical protein AUC62_01439 [Weissella cibaria]ASS51236.1 hypothetical protein CHR48_00244 [Weissella cibaria]MBA5962991.1 hypothetical protein [Weissella cibaria]
MLQEVLDLVYERSQNEIEKMRNDNEIEQFKQTSFLKLINKTYDPAKLNTI